MKKHSTKRSKHASSERSTLGSLISLVRQRNGWTLREMSDKVGIPLSTLAKVEADKLSLTYDKLQQFTSRLGMTLADFLAQADTPAAGAAPPVFHRAPQPYGKRQLHSGLHAELRLRVPVCGPAREAHGSDDYAHPGSRHQGVW